ncbi:hypothetical protein FHX75_11169 [Micromonospora palomenae]|uniref:Uncharacterized protein n=1 Tax=Micromonospora palomenae TaxID=1461247 RepID=A0A561WT69_9ACTN|nr:hypothetical protein [Micromonospora palomenae]TWG27034.1 hypothetical protein FHX75_11169 [Micromonospora palomenae]
MISLVVAALALLGGTTWLAMNQPVARNPVLNRRLTATGLLLCLITAVITLIAAVVTWR